MWAPEALKEWHDFYLLVGTAGATLLALLFVALSLGVGYLTEERQAATRTFMSPVVIHFTSVFFLSAIALLPWHQAKFFWRHRFDRRNHLDLHYVSSSLLKGYDEPEILRSPSHKC